MISRLKFWDYIEARVLTIHPPLLPLGPWWYLEKVSQNSSNSTIALIFANTLKLATWRIKASQQFPPLQAIRQKFKLLPGVIYQWRISTADHSLDDMQQNIALLSSSQFYGWLWKGDEKSLHLFGSGLQFTHARTFQKRVDLLTMSNKTRRIFFPLNCTQDRRLWLLQINQKRSELSFTTSLDATWSSAGNRSGRMDDGQLAVCSSEKGARPFYKMKIRCRRATRNSKLETLRKSRARPHLRSRMTADTTNVWQMLLRVQYSSSQEAWRRILTN